MFLQLMLVLIYKDIQDHLRTPNPEAPHYLGEV